MKAQATLCCALLLVSAAPSGAADRDPAKLLVGSWTHETVDKETGVRETTRIAFREDGSYQAQVLVSAFKQQKLVASGRYAVKQVDAQRFQLQVERALKDPESDKSASAGDLNTIAIVDDNTLKDSEGALLRRAR